MLKATVQVKGPNEGVAMGMKRNGLMQEFMHRSLITDCLWEVQRIGSEKTPVLQSWLVG